jgi:hypothetical protein
MRRRTSVSAAERGGGLGEPGARRERRDRELPHVRGAARRGAAVTSAERDPPVRR